MSEVLYEKKEHIAHIRLNRPESLNALNREAVKEIAKIWADLNGVDSITLFSSVCKQIQRKISIS